MSGGVDGLMDKTRETIEEEIKELVDGAVEKITDSMDDMVKKLSDSEEESSGARELLDPLFDQLDGFISPLIGGVDKVKDAADSVGVDF